MDKIQIKIISGFIIVFLLIVIFYLIYMRGEDEIESFTSKEEIKKGEVYDKFYSKIYDQLFYSSYKNEFEINDLISKYLKNKDKTSLKILDVGCGTGKHISILNELGYKPIGLDLSNDMLIEAKKINKNTRFIKGSGEDTELFSGNRFDVILCYYFTIYYFEDYLKFIKNVSYWLKRGGILAVHVVNKDKFDPILEPASPFPAFSLQKYSKKRIMKSTVVFNNFEYTAEFKLSKSGKAKFKEKFYFQKKNKVRKQEHIFNMFKIGKFINDVKEKYKLKLIGKTDLISVSYEYQYILYFKKG